MKKYSILFALMLALAFTANAQGYQVGDKASDFTLRNVTGEMINLYQYADAEKGAVVIFTCNHCPYAKAYEDRIIELDNKFRDKGFPVIAVNPNDPELVPEDSYEKMQERAKEKSFPFPYLLDEKQEVYKIYGATRTPHVYLLKKEGQDFKVAYIGTIDDNYKDAEQVSKKYLADAVNALLENKKPDPDFTKAIGCSIKDKSTKK
ncbi:MAG TPA: thioredoxin family protein [Bacteroidales bacterium]|nr:thioredoxin family protein [Bacteroidales bacterium]